MIEEGLAEEGAGRQGHLDDPDATPVPEPDDSE